MENIQIKNVTLDDAEFLFFLMNDTAIIRALNEIPTCREDWVSAIRAWADDDDERDYIIWKDDRQIGWFAFNGLQSADGTVYLKMAAILPEYQQSGIGSYVLSQLLDDVRGKGYSSVILFTNQNNKKARKCYENCGFKIVRGLREQMSDGATVERYEMKCML